LGPASRLASWLASAWREEAARTGVPPPPEPRGETLDAVLAAALDAGRARWPELALAPERFVAHVARAVPPSEPALADAVAALHASDLYLACACANEVPLAISRFEEAHLRHLGATLAGAVSVTPAEVDEISQRLRVRLFVGDAAAGHPPLVSSYSGRGPLSAWVRVAAIRLGLTLARDAAIGARVGRRAADEGALGAAALDPELAFIKDRYRRDFEGAFGSALGAVSDRERALLRLHVVGGLTLERIGAMYHVDRSTVSRWLADARRALLDRTERALRDRLGVAPAEFESMARLLTSQLEIDLPELLRTHGDAPHSE
jgi:RNA polymerase sigma-70 factor, ECF subfamily